MPENRLRLAHQQSPKPITFNDTDLWDMNRAGRFIEVVLDSDTCANITSKMGKGGLMDLGTGVNDNAVYEKWLTEKNPESADLGKCGGLVLFPYGCLPSIGIFLDT
jgi:hypothetical protein|eukprot:COSAG06_NODE_523_length_14708_cov_16.526593_7_plen_106_part_00